MQQAEEFLREGRVEESLAKLKEQIRQEPARADLRVFLFQMLSVVGDWDRAMTQLNVAAELDGQKLLLAEICRPALQSEALRTAIFAGEKSPLVFGEPPEWVGSLIQASQLVAQGEYAAALALRDRAFEAAPAISGHINGEPFEWIADADTRLGPVLEAVVERKYFWIPFTRIKSISIEEPQALRNAVWAEAQFVWVNGGQAPGLIPTRYAGSEASTDGLIQLARKTDWTQRDGGHCIGWGQRTLATDQKDYPLLEIRSIELDNAEPAQDAEPEPAAAPGDPPSPEEPSDG